ncbi:MAG TPA: hypothetical protein VN372_03275, partial [Methanospirillum sp.]|nr:hypothetical protein [Methanospirillum sp.]
MKTTTRVKTINGHEYLYEITYYYDKETRRTRQKSRYLGKNVDGKPVRVREKAKNPERVFSYGELIPYLTAIRTLRLDELIGSHLTEHETRVCLTLAMAALTCSDSFTNPAAWYEGTALSRIYPGLKITSQSIGKILKKLGDTAVPTDICQSFITNLKGYDTRIYDILIPPPSFPSHVLRNEREKQFYDQI